MGCNGNNNIGDKIESTRVDVFDACHRHMSPSGLLTFLDNTGWTCISTCIYIYIYRYKGVTGKWGGRMHIKSHSIISLHNIYYIYIYISSVVCLDVCLRLCLCLVFHSRTTRQSPSISVCRNGVSSDIPSAICPTINDCIVCTMTRRALCYKNSSF